MDHIVMEFSCAQTKLASLEIPLESGTSNRSSISTCSLGDSEMVTYHKERERNIIDVENVDIERCPCDGGCLYGDKERTWLSSASTSIPLLNSDDLQSLDILENDCCGVFLHDKSFARLLISRADGVINKISTFNGPTIDSIEASPVAVTVQDGVAEDLNDTENKVKGPFKGSLEEIAPLQRRFICNDLPSKSNGSWSSCNTDGEPLPSQDHAFDATNIWVSLLDLEGEDSEWDRDDSDALDPDFPSPSYRILKSVWVRSSNLSFKQSSNQLLDVQASIGSPSSIFDLSSKCISGVESPQKHSGSDEPLFWPFDWKSYWLPELEGNYLGISPRASILKIKRPRGHHSAKPLRYTLHKRNGPSQSREDIQQGHRRGILITSRSAQTTLADRKTRNPLSKVPSRLSRTSGLPSEKSESNRSMKGGKGGHPQLNSGKKKRGRDQNSSLVQYLLDFEIGEFQSYLESGVPIEALVGLSEFDGLEGIEKTMSAS